MYCIGIDGGGSRTRALLSDASGQIIGHGLSGPTNPRTTSVDDLLTHVTEVIRTACGEIDPQQISAAHLGIAGAGEALYQDQISQIARRVLTGESTHITVGHDLEIALAGGRAGAPGLILVAGTGSACYGLDGNGKTAQCGGWGDLIDDVGSGSWIGLRSLQACVRQADGRLPQSALMAAVMNFLGIDSMAEFKTRIHNQGLARNERAQLAPIIIDLAESGDAVARRILAEAIEELCQMVLATGEQLAESNDPILLSGGLTQNGHFREMLEKSLRLRLSGRPISQPQLSAACGALILALQSAKVTVDKAIVAQLRQSQPEPDAK